MSDTEPKTTLFEPGAPPGPGFIPLHVPEVRGNEWKYIKECLDTNWVSSVGPFVDRFEQLVSAYTGAKHGVAAVNGTSALHIALLVAGVQPDDEVMVPALSFVAPANAVRYAGAWPVFIDAEPERWQMDPGKAVDFLESECQWRDGALRNRITGRRVRAILPVHLLGHPVDMNPLMKAARKYGLTVIEDAAESLGARYRGGMVGHLGDIACFSFNGNKVITTGGGGMIVTDNGSWARKARYLTTQAKDDPAEYIHNEIGYNYRLTNIQAAMGCAQMEKLDEYIAIKRGIADRYRKDLAGVPGLALPWEAEGSSSIFWMYTILVDEDDYGMSSRGLIGALREAGVQARPLWQPLHLQRPFQGCYAHWVEVAPRLCRDAVSLPSSVGLTGEQQQKVVSLIKEFGKAD